MDEPRDWIVAVALAWVAQVVYTISPIDLIPDIFLGVGLLDDAIGWVAVFLLTAWGAAQVWTLLEERGRRIGAAQRTSLYEPIDPVDLVRM